MKGFQFNKETGIQQVFNRKIEVQMDGGRMIVNIEKKALDKVLGGTHYRIGCCLCSFDFVKKTFDRFPDET